MRETEMRGRGGHDGCPEKQPSGGDWALVRFRKDKISKFSTQKYGKLRKKKNKIVQSAFFGVAGCPTEQLICKQLERQPNQI
jgi:hypothetical protein